LPLKARKKLSKKNHLDKTSIASDDETSLVESSLKEVPVLTVIRYQPQANAARHAATGSGTGVAKVSGNQDFCSQYGVRLLNKSERLSIS
jgi:hypothetical protein